MPQGGQPILNLGELVLLRRQWEEDKHIRSGAYAIVPRGQGWGLARRDTIEEAPASAGDENVEQAGSGAGPPDVVDWESPGGGREDAGESGGDRGEGDREDGRPDVSRPPSYDDSGDVSEESDEGLPEPAAGDELPAEGNFVIEPDFPLGEGGKAEKIRLNLRAIEILKELQAQGRVPTVGERKNLARYTGWGGLKDILRNRAPKGPDEESSSEDRAHFRLKELVTDEEVTSILLSARNAHYYTSRDVVEAMFHVQGAAQIGRSRRNSPAAPRK